jgi:hypothetical protein
MIIMVGCFFEERIIEMHYEVYPRGVCSTQLAKEVQKAWADLKEEGE